MGDVSQLIGLQTIYSFLGGMFTSWSFYIIVFILLTVVSADDLGIGRKGTFWLMMAFFFVLAIGDSFGLRDYHDERKQQINGIQEGLEIQEDKLNVVRIDVSK